jgi:hypothetical protein
VAAVNLISSRPVKNSHSECTSIKRARSAVGDNVPLKFRKRSDQCPSRNGFVARYLVYAQNLTLEYGLPACGNFSACLDLELNFAFLDGHP